MQIINQVRQADYECEGAAQASNYRDAIEFLTDAGYDIMQVWYEWEKPSWYSFQVNSKAGIQLIDMQPSEDDWWYIWTYDSEEQWNAEHAEHAIVEDEQCEEIQESDWDGYEGPADWEELVGLNN